MTDSSSKPVEISVHFGPDEWNETGLAALVASYQDMIQAMGAPMKDTVTHVDKQEDGSVRIRVSWDRRGTVIQTMTGKDAAGRLVPHGNEPGLIMYTEEDGATYLELPGTQPPTPPIPVVPAPGPDPANHPEKKSSVPWTWFAGIVAGLLAAVGGIGWFRRKTKNN
ncbi:hypothetical protein [Arthrobacter sp. E3]|uniref:hypothetical protein n=1 Tax=Arthrobacter sp. E3 TaxID=517402 RepID=UPI001A941173|nr:hypothetical protein [Arthrobacter sp. E3]